MREESFARCHSCTKPACVGEGERARCETHFIEGFDRRVRLTIRQYDMIKPRERIVVALSGGKDSTVLLHILASLRERLPMELLALLIDEGIAGYRSKTIVTAKRECRKAKVKLHILSFKKEMGKSLDVMLKGRRSGGACTYCGVFRRRLLEVGARKLKADKLAIGHNLDDAAQTVLLNLYRNEPARLERFGPKSEGGGEMTGFTPRIRPLIDIAEKEVALYAELKGYGISRQACPYAAEAMRQTVRSQLNEMEDRYPGTKKRIFGAWLQMQKKLIDKIDKKQKLHTPLLACTSCGEPSSEKICAVCRLLRAD
ncbi:tRNA 2-thiocytidine biosynthesis protein TtcA [uncultured archaeon]|nr:tRNA 2-thiocytidine biosynthesis protein TtcA [uncultured archaeon]